MERGGEKGLGEGKDLILVRSQEGKRNQGAGTGFKKYKVHDV